MGDMSHATGEDGIALLPPIAGTCPVCADVHAPEQPHNARSLYYRLHFRQKHGRDPTWEDAMAHCKEDARIRFTAHMEKLGHAAEPKA